ncbi:MAG TPA: hypothetical protein VHS32_19060, partial [Streptosporangiaceae bacterium]|nr:hypothetical protein [Streptosporangiaceae bacterium]
MVQGVGDPQFGLGCGSGEHELLVAGEQLGELDVGQGVECNTVDDPVCADAHAAGDLCGGAAVVAGHDVDPDPGGVTRCDRGGDLGAGWVEQPHQPEQGQPGGLGVVPVGCGRFGPVPTGNSQHAQALAGHRVDGVGDRLPLGRVGHAERQQRLRGALHVHPQRVAVVEGAEVVESGHQPAAGIEGEQRHALCVAFGRV